MYKQIIGGRIFTPEGWLDGGSVLVEGKKIKAILNTDLPIEGASTIDARGAYIIPGGIEMHVHGAAGADFMDGTVEAFRTAAGYHLQQGTTTIFPTLSTSSYETIMKGIECAEVLMQDDESSVEGLHLEGPYFAVKMAGAQLPELIRPARPEEDTQLGAPRAQRAIREPKEVAKGERTQEIDPPGHPRAGLSEELSPEEPQQVAQRAA